MTAPQRRPRYEDLDLRVPPEPVRLVCPRCGDEVPTPGRCDDCVGRGSVHAGVWIALLFWLVVAIVIALVVNQAAAPRPESARSPVPARTGAPHEDSRDLGLRGRDVEAGKLVGAPSPATGWATWYDDGPGWYAAVPSWRHGDEPYAIQVCRADRPATCTHVLVRDFCACGDRRGEPTVVDLSPSAFRELAPLSLGVIRVIASGPIPVPLPPTDVP